MHDEYCIIYFDIRLVRYYLKEIQNRERSITERSLAFLLILGYSEFEKSLAFKFVFRFCGALAFRKQNGYTKDKGGDCYGTNIKCICTSGA